MAIRKHDLMYQMFGKSEEVNKCKDCEYYTTFKYHDHTYRKCEIYGVTNSEASDWKGSAQACGLYPGTPTLHRNVIRTVNGGKKRDETQIDGQMSLFGELLKLMREDET